MKRVRGSPFKAAIAAAVALLPAAGSAQPALARERICLGCHDVSSRKVGPALRDVALRYAGQKDAAARLAERIRHGSGGVWGPVPMPPNPKVTPEEATRLANWVLSLK